MTRVAVGLIACLSSGVLADGMKHIPLWTMVSGKACYEFQDAKKLVILDAELEALLQQRTAHERIIVNLRVAETGLKAALEAEKSAASTLKESNDKLNTMLVKETTRANKAESRPGPYPAWAIAGGVGLGVGIVVGVVLGVYVAK